MAADRSRHRRQIVIHDFDEALRRHALAKTGKSFHVAEQDGHDPALAVRRGQRLRVDQPLHDARIEVSAECFAHPLLVAQLFDHVIERGRQLANLVSRRDIDRSVEPPLFDGAGAIQQALDRPRNAGADEE
jgi:hypothetical protein